MCIPNEIKPATVVEAVKEVGPVEKTTTVAIKDDNKTAEEPVKDIFEQSKPLEGEDKVVQALFSGAIHAGGLRGLTGSTTTGHSKCSTCGEAKPNHQSWSDHNCSDRHIKGLVTRKGFLSAIGYLDKQYNDALFLKCDLCDTKYRNILLYNCHKLEAEHCRRKQELLRLVHIAVGQGVVDKWDKISKPKKIALSDIGRTLRHFKHHNVSGKN